MRMWLVLGVVLASCRHEAPAPPVRLWHTFGPVETEALNDALVGHRGRVEISLLPFARGQSVLGAVLRSGQDCPDLARIDATWLPGLARDGLILPAPARIIEDPELGADWVPEARELASDGGRVWAVPQTVDGLAIVARPEAVPSAWPPPSIDMLIAAAWTTMPGHRYGLGVRADGYWLVAFLRAAGADVADGITGRIGVDQPAAVTALASFAKLMGTVAPPPASPGDEARDEARRFRAGEIALLITGPWALPDLDTETLTVTALPGAPRGGQLLVVPRCARDPDAGWALAAELTAPELQAAWSRRFGMVPVTRRAQAGGAEVSRRFYAALRTAVPLPRHPASASLFDDLNPAIAAVVAGDATADEALAGVTRAWTRLLARARREGPHAAEAGGPPGRDEEATR